MNGNKLLLMIMLTILKENNNIISEENNSICYWQIHLENKDMKGPIFLYMIFDS